LYEPIKGVKGRQDLQKKLKMLDELQAIDLKIDGHMVEKTTMEGEIALLEGRMAEASSAISEKNAQLAAIEVEKAALEEGIATEQQNIARSESHQKEIKTQKEYQAVSKEIATAKKLIAEMEEQLLGKIGQIDELKGEISGLAESLSSLEQNVEAQKAEVQTKISSLDEEILGVTRAREEIVKELPASMTKRYSMLREQRRGIAVVEAKDGSCFGCNMQLPPQLYNTLFRLDDMVTCPHCQRILVLRREE
jgi:predicted  nucleic acid-binding Zn-ribbon protein